MNTNERSQEMTEMLDLDFTKNGFQLTDHPWLAEDVTLEDEIRYALDEIRL